MRSIYQPEGHHQMSPTAKYITMLLRKVSEQASWITSLKSQKKWRISKTVQKDNRNTSKFCNKEFTALSIQDTRTGSPQRIGLRITMYYSG